VTTIATGFSTLAGAVFDGTNVWVTDIPSVSVGPRLTPGRDSPDGNDEQGALNPFDGNEYLSRSADAAQLVVVRASTARSRKP
jgi:hypothetical protein